MFRRKHHRKKLEHILVENFVDSMTDSLTQQAKQLQVASLKLVKANLLGRVFNDFEPSLLIDPVIYKQLSEQFLKILPNSKYIAEDEKKGGYVMTRDKDRAHVLAWLDQIVQIACHDLLDGHGRLKNDIVDILGWKGERISQPEALVASYVECIGRDIVKNAILKKKELAFDKAYLTVTRFINRDFKAILATQLDELMQLQKSKREFAQRTHVLTQLIYLDKTEQEEAIFDTLMANKDSLFNALQSAYDDCVKGEIEHRQFAKKIASFAEKYKPDLFIEVNAPLATPKSAEEVKSPFTPITPGSAGSLSLNTPSDVSSLNLSTPKTPASVLESPGVLTVEELSPGESLPSRVISDEKVGVEDKKINSPAAAVDHSTDERTAVIQESPLAPKDDKKEAQEPALQETKRHHGHGAGAVSKGKKETFFERTLKAREAIKKFMTTVPVHQPNRSKKR